LIVKTGVQKSRDPFEFTVDFEFTDILINHINGRDSRFPEAFCRIGAKRFFQMMKTFIGNVSEVGCSMSGIATTKPVSFEQCYFYTGLLKKVGCGNTSQSTADNNDIYFK